MERSPRPRRTQINLSQPLQQRLNAYALAATAAGVGMLALTPPAQAEIVYTKAHVVIGRYAVLSYDIDLNGDGTGDVTINLASRVGDSHNFLRASRALGIDLGGVRCALKAGSRIGPKKHFSATAGLLTVTGGSNSTYGFASDTRNGWKNGAYLGIKFLINGEVHFGWARMTVKTQMSGITILVSGYAYETIPNKPIIAGKTHGADDAEQPAPASLTIPAERPATLGLLALGAPGLSLRKRKGSSEAAQR